MKAIAEVKSIKASVWKLTITNILLNGDSISNIVIVHNGWLF